MAPFHRSSIDFSSHGSVHSSMDSSANSSTVGRLSGRSSARNSFDISSSVHGRAMPLKDALDLSIHGLRPALDLTCHSTGHPQQNEFDAILAIIEEGKPMNLDEVMGLFEENKDELPPFVVDFVENRLGRFRRNSRLVRETFTEEVEEFFENLQDDEESPKEVVKDFAQARWSTFAKNMATIGYLVLREDPPVAPQRSSKRNSAA